MTGNFGFGSAGSSPPQHDTRSDVTVENHGSIFILRSITDRGHAWIEEHCASDGYQPFGDGARLVDHRYIADIVAGALADGLRVR